MASNLQASSQALTKETWHCLTLSSDMWLQGTSHTVSRFVGFAAHTKSLTRKVKGKSSFVCISSYSAAKQERQSLQNSLRVLGCTSSLHIYCLFQTTFKLGGGEGLRHGRWGIFNLYSVFCPSCSLITTYTPFVQQCRCSCVCTIFLKEFSQAIALLSSSELRTGGYFFKKRTFFFFL